MSGELSFIKEKKNHGKSNIQQSNNKSKMIKALIIPLYMCINRPKPSDTTNI